MNSKLILIVDDDPYLCQLLTAVFKRLELYTDCAFSWSEASKKMNEFDPSLILLDHNLPDGKGLNLVGIIKESCRCKVILMSADPSPIIRTLALKRGADDYIEKPFNTEDITHKVLDQIS